MHVSDIVHETVELMSNRRPSGPPDFVEHHHDGSGTTNTSETKIKERQEHHGYLNI